MKVSLQMVSGMVREQLRMQMGTSMSENLSMAYSMEMEPIFTKMEILYVGSGKMEST